MPATLTTVLTYLNARDFAFIEVIVVDDGSADRTAAVVQQCALSDSRIRLVSNPGNRGKGYAVRHGFQEARGEWVLFTDADLSTPIDEVEKLEAAIDRTHADGAIGSRAIDRSLIGVRQSAFREASGRFFNFVMRLLTGLPFRDTQCGFKLFNAKLARSVASKQQIDGFGFDVELLFIAKKHGFHVMEVPVRWNNVEGTKVSLWRGLSAFADPWQVRRNDWRGLYR